MVSVDVKHHVYLLSNLQAGIEKPGNVGRGSLYLKLFCHQKNDSCINPFTTQACKKFRAERCTHAPENGIFSGPITDLLLMLCVSMKILSHASAKEKTERLKNAKFRTFNRRFQEASRQ